MILEKKNLIVSRKKGPIDRSFFSNIEKIKKEILKEKYFLSVNFVSPQYAKELNIKYRDKDYTPNILSFPLDKDSGEIYICLSVARSEAKKFSLSYKNFLILLIVHGCLHLKGMEHGEKMEALEEKISRKFMLK